MTLEDGALLYERYRIERVLGHGGMGAVYLATDESLGLQCAVKENLSLSPEAERQFKREATLLASLRHHNLPRVTNHFVLGNQQYLVMDFVEGEDLKERLTREGPLPEVDALLWAAQICEALTYLHELNPPVIHRDIKPANIKVTADGEVMLVDFGIAKAAGAGQKTTTGAVALTPGFAPPEQYGMGRTDPRTDQYAFAATLYNLLTGQPPPDSMERLLGNQALIPPQQLRPDLSPEVGAALMRALELKPDDRFANMAAFKAALFGQTPAVSPTVPAVSVQPTVMQPPTATVAASHPTVAAQPAETVAAAPPTPPTVVAPRSGRPGWLIPAGIGGAVIVIGAIVFGFLALPGLVAARATATPTLTAIQTQVIAPVASATPRPTSTDTPTPRPPTETPTPEPLPTDTPTPEPTLTPTVTAPPIGGGGRIAFISNRDGQHYQIYTMNPDGSDVQQLTTDERDKWSPTWKLGKLGALTGTQLAWSPDGAQLLYVAEGAPGSGLDLWIINADGANPINLTAATRAGQASGDDFQPAWCSEGWIAFTSTRVNNIPQIFFMRLEDRNQRNFSAIHSSPIEYNVTWFPDCKRLLLVTTQNGVPELWRVFPFKQTYATLWGTFPPFDQQSYRVFLSDKAGYNAAVADPAISPDGQFVAYTRQAPDGNEIVVTTVSDSQLTMNIQQVTTTHSNSNPHWSPDGKYLVFVSKRDGNPEIYRMLVGGQEQTNLTNNAAIDTDPVWQPAPAP